MTLTYPTHLALQDSGLLLDLSSAGLLEPALQLSCTYCTTDLRFHSLDREIRAELEPHIQSGSLLVFNCVEDDWLTIKELVKSNSRLSSEEWSVYNLARTNDWPILVGCACLYGWVYIPPMQRFNLTWLVNELLRQAKISKPAALRGVAKISSVNPRLRVECASLTKTVEADW